MADKVRFSELSNEAVFALYYSLAIVEPEKYEFQFRRMDRLADEQAHKLGKHVLSGADKKRALLRGLNQLWERGLVDLARDAEGGHQPACVHLESLEMDGGRLILAEGQ